VTSVNQYIEHSNKHYKAKDIQSPAFCFMHPFPCLSQARPIAQKTAG